MAPRIVHLILLVASDPQRLETRHHLIRRAGYYALPTTTMSHTLMMVRKVRPSAVLAEADLADGRAPALLAALRELEAVRHVHVVVVGELTPEEQEHVARDPRAYLHRGDDGALVTFLHDLLAAPRQPDARA